VRCLWFASGLDGAQHPPRGRPAHTAHTDFRLIPCQLTLHSTDYELLDSKGIICGCSTVIGACARQHHSKPARAAASTCTPAQQPTFCQGVWGALGPLWPFNTKGCGLSTGMHMQARLCTLGISSAWQCLIVWGCATLMPAVFGIHSSHVVVSFPRSTP
jgi:hypothetical protein